MKQTFLLILLCAVFSPSFAQSKKFSFLLGSDYELPRKSDDLSFFGNDKDGIINLSLKKEELDILRFNPKTLEQSAETKIELTEATRNFNSEAVVDFGNTYYWLHSDWDKETEREYLYYDVLDLINGKITKSNVKINETSRIAGSLAGRGFYSYKTVDKYTFNFNADRTKLLISYRLFPEERNDKKNYDKIGVMVFDNQMNKLWGGEYTMPYTEAIMDNEDFSVDMNGNAFLLAKVYDNEKRKEKDKETGKPGYHYEVLKFSKDSKQIIHTSIDIGDFFLRTSAMIENSNHDLLIASTYSKKANSSGTDGVFLAIMDQSGKINKYKNGYYEFPLEELKKFESARTRRRMDKKDDYEAPNLSVRNVVTEADGSIFIALEEYFVVSTTYYDSRGGSTTYYTYYFNDILGTRINADGSFAWLRKIPKQQYGTNGRGTMSFKLVSDASGYYFLYLDNKKNMELAEDETPKAHVDGWGGQVVVSKIDNNGTVSKELVFDTRDEDVKIFPSQFRRINHNQFIGRAVLKRNKYKPLLITVNQ